MNRIRFCFFLFAIFILPLYPARAETVILSLEEAVTRALDNSLNLKKSAVDLAQTEYSARRLWAEIFPGFSLSAGLDFLPRSNLFTEPGFSYNSEDLSYSLNLGLSLSLNPSLGASMKRIELAYRTQLLSYENARKQLEMSVIKNFLNLITQKENIAYLEESLTLAEQKLGTASIARENGLLSELALLDSRLAVETARYDLALARGNYQIALGEFLALLGMDNVTDVDFSGNIEIAQVQLDPEQLILDYLPKRPDIMLQRQTIERLELTRSINTLGSRAPTLNLSSRWQGGNSSGGFDAPFTDSLSGSLTLTIPIDSWIPGTRQSQNIRIYGADVEKAALDLQNTETAAKTQIRSLVSNLKSTWENIEIARLRVEIAERTAEAYEEGFRNGTVEFQDLEDTRKNLNDFRQRLLQGEFSWQSLLLDLSAALNVDWRTLARSVP